MDSSRVLFNEIPALFNSPLDPDLLNRLGVILVPVYLSLESCREVCSCSEVRHSVKALDAGDGHDACDKWNVDSDEITSLSPVVECGIVEEQLRRDPVCPGIDLLLEKPKLLFFV